MTIEEHNNRIETIIQDLKDAISGTWQIDQFSPDTESGFKGMIKDLKKCIIKTVKIN